VETEKDAVCELTVHSVNIQRVFDIQVLMRNIDNPSTKVVSWIIAFYVNDVILLCIILTSQLYWS